MMRLILLMPVLIFLFSCKQNENVKNLDKAWLDYIIRKSDSSYVKPYFRTDFVKACYYVNKKDSTLTQLMKDSADRVRQIIIMKNDVRLFYAQYFSNGNLQAQLPLDEFGQYHGTGIFYYENGEPQSTGNYNHGFKTGEWKVYDEKGKLTATDKFDEHGQLIQQAHP